MTNVYIHGKFNLNIFPIFFNFILIKIQYVLVFLYILINIQYVLVFIYILIKIQARSSLISVTKLRYFRMAVAQRRHVARERNEMG